MADADDKSGGDTPPATLRFEYEKSAQFRTIFADGAIGGVTPRGYVHVAFYSERSPIPKVVVHELNETGTLGKELLDKREGRKGVFRELEVSVVMDEQAAVALHQWLNEKIVMLQKYKAEEGADDE